MTIRSTVNDVIADLTERLAERVARTTTTAIQVRDVTIAFITEETGGRALIAKLARSEVKNYLAALCEEAGVPFTGPTGFITMTHDQFLKLAPPVADEDPAP